MGKYDRWRQFFEELEGGSKTMTLEELESLVDGELPPSARQYSAWWNGDRYYAYWREHGWDVSTNLRVGEITFYKTGSKPVTASKSREEIAAAGSNGEDRLILLGCVKTKAHAPLPAKDLYQSPLWMKRRRYAEATGMPWAILSAEHGMIDPDTVIEPYDRYMGDQSTQYRRRWSEETADQVIRRLRPLHLETVEVHAGSEYLENGLVGRLREEGVSVLRPLRGLAFGQQLAWYDNAQ